MPDSAPDKFVYTRAVRGRFAPLIMISGPSGTGKTYSALRVARGIAGEDGKIFVADTDNSRARLYADAFDFLHLDLHEPFRPMLFEEAAVAAQKQGAAVLIIDNFAHEWTGPGGVLEWHEEEVQRLSKGDFSKREQYSPLAWAKVKPAHKHMRDRLYMANVPMILCCAAEKKIAIQKVADGPRRGKTEVVDLGFQPIVGGDIAYAMTLAVMLTDPAKPGVPTPIKALLPDLQPIVSLEQPLDEETGARIAAWARGDRDTGATQQQQSSQQQRRKPPPSEAEIEAGAKALAERFKGTTDRASHLALAADPDVAKQREWLTVNRRELFDRIVGPAMTESWDRTKPADEPEPQQQSMLEPPKE